MTVEYDDCKFFSCNLDHGPDCDMSCCDNCSHGIHKLCFKYWKEDFWHRYILGENNAISPCKLYDWFIYLYLWIVYDRKPKKD